MEHTTTKNFGGHDYGREDLGCGALAARVAEDATTVSLADLCTEIHASNRVAGWWTDLKSGESILETRNRPEMLMLAVSEIAEAATGAFGERDDKLPHLPMYDVELADFVIRQLDQIGAELSLGHEMLEWSRMEAAVRTTWHVGTLRAMSRTERLMELVKLIAAAMEHYRKGRVAGYVNTMAEGVLLAFELASYDGIDLLDIIAQKRAFNATRADHQVANRAKEDGKRF